MALFDPEKKRSFNLLKKGYTIDADKLAVLIDDVKDDEIVHLPPDLVKSVAPGLGCNPNYMYAAASGVYINYDYHGEFKQGEKAVAIELVRYEPNPKKNEPHYNLNRSLWGLSAKNDKCYGIDVTTVESNPVTGQVGEHWDEIENYISRHFGSGSDRTIT